MLGRISKFRPAIEQRPNNDRTTTEQRPNTLQERKKLRSKELRVAAEAALIIKKTEFESSLTIYKYTYPAEMIAKFCAYWSEANKSKTKLRWETEKTWETNLRLSNWSKREFNNPAPASSKANGRPGQIMQPTEERKAELLEKFETLAANGN